MILLLQYKLFSEAQLEAFLKLISKKHNSLHTIML